jgi:hypothetical protein
LLAFLAGMVVLLRAKEGSTKEEPTPRQLALLLGLPFLVNCIAALAGLYPYGGTRHSAVLALFGLGGASIGLSRLKTARAWITPVIVAAGLAVCNFFPAPPPPIKARNHTRILMLEAVDTLRRSAAPGSILFADYQSGLLLGYYACGHGVVQMFPPFAPFAQDDCGPYRVITARPQEWKFYADDLPAQLAGVAQTYGLAPGTKLWLFDGGWNTDTAPALRKQLRETGGTAPLSYGENILLCQVEVSRTSTKPKD